MPARFLNPLYFLLLLAPDYQLKSRLLYPAELREHRRTTFKRWTSFGQAHRPWGLITEAKEVPSGPLSLPFPESAG